MTDTGPTYPDLPPIVDERSYQVCLRTIAGLEERADPYDSDLLRKLRRAAELYEQTMPGASRSLVVRDCDCGECTECRLRVDLAFAKSQRDDNESAWQAEKAKRLAHETTIVMLQRRLQSRNHALKELSRGAIDFTGGRAQPEDAETTREMYFYLLSRAHANRALHYEHQLRAALRDGKAVRTLQRRVVKLAKRLHVQRAVSRYWSVHALSAQTALRVVKRALETLLKTGRIAP